MKKFLISLSEWASGLRIQICLLLFIFCVLNSAQDARSQETVSKNENQGKMGGGASEAPLCNGEPLEASALPKLAMSKIGWFYPSEIFLTERLPPKDIAALAEGARMRAITNSSELGEWGELLNILNTLWILELRLTLGNDAWTEFTKWQISQYRSLISNTFPASPISDFEVSERVKIACVTRCGVRALSMTEILNSTSFSNCIYFGEGR